jgi:hypothetical protein
VSLLFSGSLTVLVSSGSLCNDTYIQMHCLVCCVIQMHCVLTSLLQAGSDIDITRLHILCLRLNLTSSSRSTCLYKQEKGHVSSYAHKDAPIPRPCRLVEARTPLNNNCLFFGCIDISISYIFCRHFTFLICPGPLRVLPSG